MSKFQFESANEGQFIKVIAGLKEIDPELVVLSKVDADPFESDLIVKVEMEASYESVLDKISAMKNLDQTVRTLRPIQ